MSPHRAASPSIVHGCIGGCAACSTSHPTTGIAANMLTRSRTPCIERLILAPSKVRGPEQMIPYTAQTCYRSAAAPSRKTALPKRRSRTRSGAALDIALERPAFAVHACETASAIDRDAAERVAVALVGTPGRTSGPTHPARVPLVFTEVAERARAARGSVECFAGKLVICPHSSRSCSPWAVERRARLETCETACGRLERRCRKARRYNRPAWNQQHRLDELCRSYACYLQIDWIREHPDAFGQHRKHRMKRAWKRAT